MAMQRTPLLMSTLLENGARVAPKNEIVSATGSGTKRLSYSEVRGRAHQLAHALKAVGVQQGDRVGTFLWNDHRHLECYHAICSMGAVMHTINIRLGPADLKYIINHAQDSVIIAGSDIIGLLEPIAAELKTVRKVIIAVDEGFEDCTTSLPDTEDYETFIAGHPDKFEWPIIDENSPLGLCYTSGTTGNPKGVEYEHRSQYLHTLTQCLTDAMSLSASDCILGIVPMFHALGWGLPYAATMLGSKQVMPSRYMTPESLCRLMADERVTISAGVPTIWQGVKAAVEANPNAYDFSALERVTCGGSAPPPSLIKWYWHELGVEMIQGWGMTETSPLATLSRFSMKYQDKDLSDEERFANMCKAGQIMPGLEVEIFDDTFNPLPHDGKSVGEILIRGPWICSEYYNNPQPDKFHGEWLITGDVGMIDEEQYLVINDRSKDLVKSGGEWISSVDLENHIVALEGVAQACVVAAPHPKWDERPVALVVQSEEGSVTPEQIITHCATKFAKWQLPDDVLFVDSVPLTSTGKMDKKVVRAKLSEQGYVLPDLRSS